LADYTKIRILALYYFTYHEYQEHLKKHFYKPYPSHISNPHGMKNQNPPKGTPPKATPPAPKVVPPAPKVTPPNAPSKTGNPSGPGRGNNPPKRG
jgi:hypothetical protein